MNISDNKDNNFDDLKQFNKEGKRKDMEEIKNDNRVKYIETNPKIYKSESNTERFVNHDLTTSDNVDSVPKIDFDKNFPAGFEDKESNVDFSERSDVMRKAKFTVVDQTKSDKTMKVPKYPTHPHDKLDSSYMAVAVGVLVTVIIILIVAIVFILHKNCQYQRENCLKTVQTERQLCGSYDTVHSSGQPQTILYQPGLRGSQISEEVYPLYSAYNNNTMLTYPYNSYRPPPTNHYATPDLIYLKDYKNSTFLI